MLTLGLHLQDFGERSAPAGKAATTLGWERKRASASWSRSLPSITTVTYSPLGTIAAKLTRGMSSRKTCMALPKRRLTSSLPRPISVTKARVTAGGRKRSPDFSKTLSPPPLTPTAPITRS